MRIKSTKELRKTFGVKGIGIWNFKLEKGRFENEYHVSANYSWLAMPVILIGAIICGFIGMATGFIECIENCNPNETMISHYCDEKHNKTLYELIKKDIDKVE